MSISPQTPLLRPARPPLNTLGRSEPITDISVPLTAGVANNQIIQPPGNILPNDRFAERLNLQWEGRIANAASNNPSGTQADAPFGLMDSVSIGGLHKPRNAQENFVNVRGTELRRLAEIQQSRTPLSTPASLSTTASANNDIRFITTVYFTPMGIPLWQRFDWLLDLPNYDSPYLRIAQADDQNIFTYGTRGAPTFSANGSGSGNPRVRVSARFAQSGPMKFLGFVPARKWLEYFEDASTDLTNTANALRLAPLAIPKGNRIRGVLLKTGVKSTAVTSGNTAFASVSNTILANIKFNKGLNRPIRNYADYFQAAEDSAQDWSFAPASGYTWVDWCPNGTWHEALDLTAATAGTTGDIDTVPIADVTGASNQSAVFLYEELRGVPLYPALQALPQGWRWVQPSAFMGIARSR